MNKVLIVDASSNGVVDNINAIDIIEIMRGDGAVDVIQRPAIDRQLVETVAKYARPENVVLQLDNTLIPRSSKQFKDIEKSITEIAATNANCIIFGECGMGREQIARQIYLQSSRTQKPLIMLEAGGAALVGKHAPESDRSARNDSIQSWTGTPGCEAYMHSQLIAVEDGSRRNIPRQSLFHSPTNQHQCTAIA